MTSRATPVWRVAVSSPGSKGGLGRKPFTTYEFSKHPGARLPFSNLFPFISTSCSLTIFGPALLAFNFSLLSSVQFSRSVVSDFLRPQESRHTRPPCPSPTPGVYSNSRPSSQLCHPAISSSVVAFSSYPQSLPASGSFPMSQLFA